MHRRLALRERAQTQIEHPDPTPLEITVDRRPPTLKEQLQAYIRQQISLGAQAEGYDSFEEEDDFEDDDNEGDWYSPHELRAMSPDQVDDQPLETLDGTDESPAPTPETPPPVDDTGGNADSL